MSISQSISSWIHKIAGSGARDVVLGPEERVSLSAGAIRIGVDQLPLEIRLGDVELVLWREAPLSGESFPPGSPVHMADRERLGDGIFPFVRLAAGDRFAMDPASESQRVLFARPDHAFRHRLQIHNDGSALTLRERVMDREACVFPVTDDRVRALVDAPRRARETILEHLGGQVALLEPAEALDVLRQVNAQLATDPCIAPGRDGRPGAILHLPDGPTPILLGDLHGRVENLLSALCRNAFFESMLRGDAVLVLLGDLVHPDDDAGLEDMSGSLLILDLVLQLKRRFPAQVHMTLGNHDSFSPELVKGGFLQGPLWEQALLKTRGAAYRDAVGELYARLPLIVTSNQFSACHAGPPRSSLDPSMLDTIRARADLIHELTWNRPAGRGRPEGYTARDVNRFRSVLGLPRAPLVTAHHPRSPHDTVWTDVANVKGHHVVFSSRPDNVGVMTRVGGALIPQVYPVEPLSSFTGSSNSLGSAPGSSRT